MGHVRDRHTEIGPGGRRIHNARWGKGKRWQARWIEDGRERSGSFETKDAALLHLARVESGVAPVIAEGTLFSTYAESWLSHRLDLRTNSRSQIRSRLDTRILPSFGDRPLAGITKADVRAAVASWAGAPRTVSATFGTLSQILKAAADEGLIVANPATGAKMPRAGRDRLQIPDAAKVKEIREAMAPHLRSMVTVAAATGLRLGELRGLTVDRCKGEMLTVDRQLDLNSRGWGDVKTDAGVRKIKMGKVARDAIKEHLETYGTGPDGLIWRTRDNRPLPQRVAVAAWGRMRAKVDGLPARGGWHLLRHYNASVLIAAGLSVRAVADRLGHDDPAITLRTYSHLWPTDQAAAADAIDAALSAPPSSQP